MNDGCFILKNLLILIKIYVQARREKGVCEVNLIIN